MKIKPCGDENGGNGENAPVHAPAPAQSDMLRDLRDFQPLNPEMLAFYSERRTRVAEELALGQLPN